MPAVKCPLCKSQRIWRDGIRQTRNGDIQRWLCRECGYRFSETNYKGCSGDFKRSEYDQSVHRLILKTPEAYFHNCRVSDRRQGGAKNLVKVETRQKQAAGATTKSSLPDVKGKIVGFLWELKKEGFKSRQLKLTIDTFNN